MYGNLALGNPKNTPMQDKPQHLMYGNFLQNIGFL